ncbi:MULTISPECIES: agmatinase family protein [Flavobacterium]|jgi:agmatinase|uniref:agmatinase family protein n=1 Tax=Flavobacterium TaxID=237 RepID=UPI000A908E5E|nr:MULTISPECIES: agmatinase family protein [Flavobacterium]MBU7570183.1 agmatinase family protein [Flavobacterium sp.]MDQ7960755.1 agmatinase family protein [Flavobacterium lindanitolerans]PZO27172.1 MAG: agmatinase [Flavobacteriaceae bacterium]PZQ91246.1 MAG: agmatinase [Flavobacterium johnsoniae]
MTKEQIIKNFDPSQPGLADASIFGLPFSAEDSEIIIIPVPWEVTVSYGAGASEGPDAILDASFQVDLHHQEFPELWKLGIYLDQTEQTEKWAKESEKYKSLAQPIIEALESGEVIESLPGLQSDLDKINKVCKNLKEEVKERVLYWTKKGKKVALLGGDHSTPLGYYEALATQHNEFGLLHLDAHMDLRIAYEGFTYSHASIMYNALQIPEITKIVQVGIRDFCQQEVETAFEQGNRVLVHTDMDLKAETFTGKTWEQQCEAIIAALPQKVAISFDIDGMYPWYCPNTGTPVPGGFSFEQAAYLLSKLGESGKEIIGFDLVEVAPGDDDWDGNVGARMLFHMCGVLAKNNGLPVGQKIKFNR